MCAHLNASRGKEVELAERARIGDQIALHELFRRYQNPIYRHARHMLGDDALAQDIVQESFCRAIASLERTQPNLNFKAWIFRIATNLCLRELNKRSRCFPSHEVNDGSLAADHDSHLEGDFLSGEIRTIVKHALGELSEKYRQILLLRELEELSYCELAEVLELSENNVKVTLHRARERFAILVMAEQLLANPHISMTCVELEKLVQMRSSRRSIEQHLECCHTCSKEKLPIADLFSALPPLPLVPPSVPISQAEGSASQASTGEAAHNSTSAMTASDALSACAVAQKIVVAGSGGLTTSSWQVWIIILGVVALGSAAGFGVYLFSKHSPSSPAPQVIRAPSPSAEAEVLKSALKMRSEKSSENNEQAMARQDAESRRKSASQRDLHAAAISGSPAAKQEARPSNKKHSVSSNTLSKVNHQAQFHRPRRRLAAPRRQTEPQGAILQIVDDESPPKSQPR